MTSSISEGLARVAEAVDKARAALAAETSASPVTVAVVDEFARKTDKARGAADRDAVIELEQAGDSAKIAAEADDNISADARQLVLDAHLTICRLKAEHR